MLVNKKIIIVGFLLFGLLSVEVNAGETVYCEAEKGEDFCQANFSSAELISSVEGTTSAELIWDCGEYITYVEFECAGPTELLRSSSESLRGSTDILFQPGANGTETCTFYCYEERSAGYSSFSSTSVVVSLPSISANVTSGTAPLNVDFTLTDGTGCTNYMCGDGLYPSTYEYEKSFSCRYATAGSYTASISCGGGSITKTITVNDSFRPSISANVTSGTAPLNVDFTLTDGTGCTNYMCGDGLYPSTYEYEKSFSCRYATAGSYTASISCGGDNITKMITVTDSTESNCANDTCQGNSCWDETINDWSYGTKVEGCATVTAAANPSSITPISDDPPSPISYITWEAKDASALYVSCTGTGSGMVEIPIGWMYLTDEQWYEKQTDYKKSSSEPDGYPAWFHVGSSGIETCIFYPINSGDGMAGIPKSVTITVGGAGGSASEESARCGTANGKTFSFSQKSWKDDTLCASGSPIPVAPVFPEPGTSVKWKCQQVKEGAIVECSTKRDTKICKPDDVNCAARTCKNRYCWNGCELVKGTSNDCD